MAKKRPGKFRPWKPARPNPPSSHSPPPRKAKRRWQSKPNRSPARNSPPTTKRPTPSTSNSFERMRIAYLGPAGTFTEDALTEALGGADFEPQRTETVFDAISAVIEGRADRALAPYENSIEGSVRGTLDILAFEAPNVAIIGEHDYPVRQHLIVKQGAELGQ